VTFPSTSVADRYANQDPESLRPLVVLTSENQRELIHQLRDQAEAWLASRGIDQYTASPQSKSAFAHADIDRLFEAGQFVGIQKPDERGAVNPDSPIAAVLAITEPDPDFWTPEEMAEPQAYISRFLVAEHGGFHGKNLLFAVQKAEVRHGSRWLRLDCWRTNKKLHQYYLDHGFQRVRTQTVEGRMSGELFEFDLQKRATAIELEERAKI
jgi:hypothetical protein